MVEYAREARRDLAEIYNYLLERSQPAADVWIQGLYARCAPLGRLPLMGRPQPDIAAGARSLVYERWLIFYELVDGAPVIVRVVDGRRDLTRLRWPT